MHSECKMVSLRAFHIMLPALKAQRKHIPQMRSVHLHWYWSDVFRVYVFLRMKGKSFSHLSLSWRALCHRQVRLLGKLSTLTKVLTMNSVYASVHSDWSYLSLWLTKSCTILWNKDGILDLCHIFLLNTADIVSSLLSITGSYHHGKAAGHFPSLDLFILMTA